MFKRLVIAAVAGLVLGLFCVWGASHRGVFDRWFLVSAVLNRITIGIAIAISAINMKWALHGALIGLIFGLPLSVAALSFSGFSSFVAF